MVIVYVLDFIQKGGNNIDTWQCPRFAERRERDSGSFKNIKVLNVGFAF